jgi:hypothetical protein
MTEYILSIDPGLSSGVALIGYEPDKAPWLEKAWQFGTGVAGMKAWIRKYWSGSFWDSYNDEPNTRGFYSWKMGVDGPLDFDGHIEHNYESDNEDDWEAEVPGNVIVIAEKFTARNTKGFSYTTASLEALRVEGGLVWEGLMPDYSPSEKRYRDPNLQYLVGGKDLADKKKRRDRFLKESGFYVTPKELGAPDANDARSAISHGLNYLAREVKHKPTWNLITDWTEANG